jgi:acyl-coenzyme A synthetase/AMP-(fatty) acid ligase
MACNLATVEDDGTLVAPGRGALSVGTGGGTVAPGGVEAVLKGHPAVADAIVVGVPDERFGDQVVVVAAVVAAVRAPDGRPAIARARRMAGGGAPAGPGSGAGTGS